MLFRPPMGIEDIRDTAKTAFEFQIHPACALFQVGSMVHSAMTRMASSDGLMVIGYFLLADKVRHTRMFADAGSLSEVQVVACI